MDLFGNDEIGSPTDRFFYLSNVNMNNDEKGLLLVRTGTVGEDF